MAVIMTKDLAEKMAQDYREAIAEATSFDCLRGGLHQYRRYLTKKNLEHGMCFLSEVKYGVDLEGCEWIVGLIVVDDANVYKTPIDKFTIPEMVECLQYRLNLLEQFIKENQ